MQKMMSDEEALFLCLFVLFVAPFLGSCAVGGPSLRRALFCALRLAETIRAAMELVTFRLHVPGRCAAA